ncbi:MAG: hypothetical protein H5T92_06160, partial [Synergistales bacterium]|nr:hypothetical protein [Synergistales bacterium]
DEQRRKNAQHQRKDHLYGRFHSHLGGGSVADAADAAAVTTAFQSAARALSTQVVITAARPDRLSGSQPVVVTGIAGGLAFRATAIADLATGTADPTPPGATPQEVPGIADSADSVARGPVSAASLLFAVLAMFVGMFVLVLAVASPSLRSAKSQRLDAIEQFRPGRVRTRAESRASEQHSVATQLVGASERLMASRESTGRTLALIERADLPLRAGEWLLLRIVCVLAGGTLGYVLSGSSLIGLAVGFALGLLVPPLVLRFLAARRARRFEQVLPDVMMLVATSLSSGFSLIQALDAWRRMRQSLRIRSSPGRWLRRESAQM